MNKVALGEYLLKSDAGPVGLQSIGSEDIEGSDRTTVRAEVITAGPKHDTVEQIVTRLPFEPGIGAVSWSVVPTMTE